MMPTIKAAYTDLISFKNPVDEAGEPLIDTKQNNQIILFVTRRH
jgi:hypothetical protein